MQYHAHVYWTDESGYQQAMGMRKILTSLGCGMGQVHNVPIGPHPLPMYQATYTDRNKSAVERYLRNNHGDLSILLHDDTGRHERDHTDGARWIGKPVTLDIDFLRRIDAHGDDT